jgi:exonuclease III
MFPGYQIPTFDPNIDLADPRSVFEPRTFTVNVPQVSPEVIALQNIKPADDIFPRQSEIVGSYQSQSAISKKDIEEAVAKALKNEKASQETSVPKTDSQWHDDNPKKQTEADIVTLPTDSPGKKAVDEMVREKIREHSYKW